ncbi:MAG: endonuclease III [Dehalococcoidia bacterium]|nr:endonuclease III [Dehalococcoidia bacterium]
MTTTSYTPAEIIDRLTALYGQPEWRPHGDAIAELVLTLLSQNTADSNSGRAFNRLLQRFPDWQAVAGAPVDAIEDAIRPGGLAPTKAPRLKAMLTEIKQRTGAFDLRFLEDLPVDQAREWLRTLPAVGPKTAACVLLFGLGMPGLPVDTHVYRVAVRLGLVSPSLTPEKVQTQLEADVPPADHFRFHVLLIRHGRHMCSARAPACPPCPLLPQCPTGRQIVNPALSASNGL